MLFQINQVGLRQIQNSFRATLSGVHLQGHQCNPAFRHEAELPFRLRPNPLAQQSGIIHHLPERNKSQYSAKFTLFKRHSSEIEEINLGKRNVWRNLSELLFLTMRGHRRNSLSPYQRCVIFNTLAIYLLGKLYHFRQAIKSTLNAH